MGLLLLFFLTAVMRKSGGEMEGSGEAPSEPKPDTHNANSILIYLRSLAASRVLGTNETLWVVQPGRVLYLYCQSSFGPVNWTYPKVQNDTMPEVKTHNYSIVVGQSLTYYSVELDNTGYHTCYLQENSTVSRTIYINVTDAYHQVYSTLPGVGWYKVILKVQKWDEARRYCEADGAHLAVPSSHEELLALHDVSRYIYPDGYNMWLGVRSDKVWIDVKEQPYNMSTINNMSKIYVDTAKDNARYCGEFNYTLKVEILVTNCSMRMPFVCEKISVNSTCPVGFEPPLEGVCYMLNDTEVTWDQARDSCNALGAHLAVPTSHDQQLSLRSLLIKLTNGSSNITRTWFGVSHISVAWWPVQGEQRKDIISPHWAPEYKRGDGDCVTMQMTALYYRPCNLEYIFICEKNEECWHTDQVAAPRIKFVGRQPTRILGTNGNVWGVNPESEVVLNCTSLDNVVEWDYPEVHENIKPNVTGHIWDEIEGKLLAYSSVNLNNSGVHRCRLRGHSNISSQFELQVSNNFTNRLHYDVLPGVGSYKTINTKHSWDGAQGYCANIKSHLAVPGSRRELEALMELANYSPPDTKLWLGVRQTGIWTAVGDQKYDESSFKRWTTELTRGRGRCVAMYDYKMVDYPCTYRRSFLCKQVTDPVCLRGYKHIASDDCYTLNHTYSTWEEAWDSCQNSGAQFAVPESQDVMDRLVNYFASSTTGVWVGIHRINEMWTAVEGEAESIANFRTWLPQFIKGNGDCIFLNKSGVFIKNCLSVSEFICKNNQAAGKDPPKVPWLIIVLVVAVVMTTTISVVLCFKKHQENIRRQNLLQGRMDDQTSESPFINLNQMLPYNERWEVPARNLELGQVIGVGEFGLVKKGLARYIIPGQTVTTVAVKTVKQGADQSCLEALIVEMKVLSHMGKHLNLVNLLGACTMDLGKGKLLVILEYCSFGNLKSYLLDHRSSFVDQLDPDTGTLVGAKNLHRQDSCEPSTSGTNARKDEAVKDMDYDVAQTMWVSSMDCYAGVVSTRDLLTWSYQISKGMEYLMSRKVMHGDLAARNVLLADNNVVKICDFGLSRKLSTSEYYKKMEGVLLPVKWLSPEAMTDLKFSTQSDVWAFGVLMWELFTLGESPYPGVPLHDLCTRLQGGYRMEKPTKAPNEIYPVMLQCWLAQPERRPSFTVLAEALGTQLGDSVIDEYMKLNDPYMRVNAANTEKDYMKDLPAPTYNASPPQIATTRGALPPIPTDETEM